MRFENISCQFKVDIINTRESLRNKVTPEINLVFLRVKATYTIILASVSQNLLRLAKTICGSHVKLHLGLSDINKLTLLKKNYFNAHIKVLLFFYLLFNVPTKF